MLQRFFRRVVLNPVAIDPAGDLARQTTPAPLKENRWSHVVSVFTLPERDIRRLDIRLGPCVPPVGRSRPLIGVTRQRPGLPEQFEALFALLGQTPGQQPWQSIEAASPGQLATFSVEFVAALASLNREGLRRGEVRPKDYEWNLEPYRAVADQWLNATAWASGVHGMDELVVCSAWALVAQDRGQKLYCWSGPGFSPYVLASGTMEELTGYLAAKRRG